MSPSRPPTPRPARVRGPAAPTPDQQGVRNPAVYPHVRPTRAAAPHPPAEVRPTTAADEEGAVPRALAALTAPSRTTYEVRRFRGPVRPAVVSTRSAERFAERARAARTLARRQIALVVGGVLAILGLGYLILFSPVFALDTSRATVTGAGTVVAVDQVVAVVAAHEGTPLPRLDVGRVRAEVLQVPGVRDATVSRHWPRGLTVALVSREPVAAVPERQPPEGVTGLGFALLDEDGVQVGRSATAPAGLPVVTVPVQDPRTLQAVLSVVRQLPADLASQVGAVSAQTQDAITMTLRDGVTVDWGSAEETPLKAAVLTALRASPAAAGVHTIDVSAPRMPITK